VSVRRGDTVYSIRALPVGGFVRMPGMLGVEGESDWGPRNFNRAPLPWRAATIVAGVLFNLVFGALCWSVSATQPTQSQVLAGDPAAAAGLRSGDVVLSMAGVTIDQSSASAQTAAFHAADAASQGRPVPLTYRGTDGRLHTTTVTPALLLFPNVTSGPFPSGMQGSGAALVVTAVDGRSPGTGDPGQILGGGGTVTVSGHPDGSTTAFTAVSISGVRDGDGTQSGYTAAWRIGYGAPIPGEALPQALLTGFQGIPAYTGSVISAIGGIFAQPSSAGGSFIGPVGIAAVAGSAVQQGWVQFIYVLGWISIALGLVNVLPIPFLDGGRLLFIGVEAVRRRQIAPARQAGAIVVSLGLLILVAVLITINDIGHLSSGGTP
jgi:regulator of sigma E protease